MTPTWERHMPGPGIPFALRTTNEEHLQRRLIAGIALTKKQRHRRAPRARIAFEVCMPAARETRADTFKRWRR